MVLLDKFDNNIYREWYARETLKNGDFKPEYDGQVIVALTEEGNTLKRIRYESGVPVLYAENKSYPEIKRMIRPKKLTVQGVALKLIKDIR